MKRVASTLLLLACLVDANAATIVVTTTGSSDAGCTLEDAIVAANQNLAVGACAAGQAAPESSIGSRSRYRHSTAA